MGIMTLREYASTFHLSVSRFEGVTSFRDYFVLSLLFFSFLFFLLLYCSIGVEASG